MMEKNKIEYSRNRGKNTLLRSQKGYPLLTMGFCFYLLALSPLACHSQSILETDSSPEEIWSQCKEDLSKLKKKAQEAGANFSERVWLAENKILPKEGGIRVVGLNGPDWVGEIRICTIPKNIFRGRGREFREYPPIIIGMIYKKRGDSTNSILTYPENKMSLEYLNLGGDWLGYELSDTQDAPEIKRK